MGTLLTGDMGFLLLVGGGLVAVIVAIVAILLPILVFRILGEIADMNKKLNRVLTLLGEMGREGGGQRGAGGTRPGDEPARLGGGRPSSNADIGDKPMRFK